ncbi:uroporphyrinogen-III synthase [Peribacillus sp. B-H-3]|uniref:uroporphyrinogen-III synthase n=1 Tax=Peribacillus sp. B-H-3 TaxID=3400420 RepID=UPI003B0119EA
MGKGLAGRKVAIGGSRKTEEMSLLIEKQGGIPVVRSLQGTIFLAEEQTAPHIMSFIDFQADWSIFTTGAGIETLIKIAGKMDMEEQFLQAVRETNVASRGYKTASVLKKLGIDITAGDSDGTTRGLVQALKSFDFKGKKVMVQLHGEKAPSLISFLEDNGASVMQILPYQHIAPERETVGKLCSELIRGEMDAVCFTTAIQVSSLFDFARKEGCLEGLVHAFGTHAMAAAVGKVTAAALKEEGIERVLAPEKERMGAMVVELSRYYENQ